MRKLWARARWWERTRRGRAASMPQCFCAAVFPCAQHPRMSLVRDPLRMDSGALAEYVGWKRVRSAQGRVELMPSLDAYLLVVPSTARATPLYEVPLRYGQSVKTCHLVEVLFLPTPSRAVTLTGQSSLGELADLFAHGWPCGQVVLEWEGSGAERSTRDLQRLGVLAEGGVEPVFSRIRVAYGPE